MADLTHMQVLLVTILLLWVSQECQPNNQITDFWSSSASFDLSSNATSSLSLNYQTYNITLPRKYDRTTNIQYAFALKDMSVLSSNIYYFDLLVLKTFESSIVVNFIYQPNKWSKVAYNYWITFRTDLYIGVESYTQDNIVVNEGKYQISMLIRDEKLSKKSIATVFLNGIRFDSSNTTQIDNFELNFVIQKQFINQGELIFIFICDHTLPLSSITFSYVVFSPHQIALVSYGGIVSQANLSSIQNKDLRYILPTANSYSLFGISSITANKSFTYSSTLLDNYTFSFGVNTWEKITLIEATYLFLGQSPANLCLKNLQCQQSAQLYIFGNQCVQNCPPTTKPVSYIDGAVECVSCPPNMVFSSTTHKCTCMSGYILQSKGICTQQVQGVSGALNARMSSSDSLSPDAQSTSKADCLKIVSIQQNNKNLFITIQASNSVLLDGKSGNKNYVQLVFPNSNAQASSYYCNVSEQDITQYSCLVLYTLGIPSGPFDVVARCTVDQGNGNLSPCSTKYTYTPVKSR